MKLLVAVSKITAQSGFNLIELLTVTVIVAISAALSVPSLLNSLRDNQTKQAFDQIKAALIEAQTTANRISDNCAITIAEGSSSYSITGSTYVYTQAGNTLFGNCVTSPATIDKSVVSIQSSATSTTPLNLTITYDFEGNTANDQTLLVSRKSFSGTAIQETGRCLVISPALGMIRFGLYAPDNTIVPNDADSFPDCNSIENQAYDRDN